MRNSAHGRIVKQKGGNKETSSGRKSFFYHASERHPPHKQSSPNYGREKLSKAHFARFYRFPCSINIAFWLIFNFRLETSAYLVLGWWHCIYLVLSSIARSSAKSSSPALAGFYTDKSKSQCTYIQTASIGLALCRGTFIWFFMDSSLINEYINIFKYTFNVYLSIYLSIYSVYNWKCVEIAKLFNPN